MDHKRNSDQAPPPDADADRDGTVESERDLVAEQHSRGGEASHSPFPIVAIGASAGGLEAFTQLLSSVPGQSNMAFVLVQHLDPHHESSLSDLLSRVTTMPVNEAVNGVAVRPNQVYVIPPNANMAIAEGALHITPRHEGRGQHLPIDFLFRSLAEDQQARAIGVVLSGTGSDGTLGLCEIKAVGGITFAQDEDSARHQGMPHSAAESGCVDFVMSPPDIARRLMELGRHPYLDPTTREDGDRPAEHDGDFKKILSVVRTVTGVDFSLYRDTTTRRRVMRRMALHTQNSWSDYLKRLKEDRREVDALYHDLLINVTSFFRDAEMFEVLKTRVFPEVIKGRSPSSPIRVWIPGCSTGQEAYSIAIALLEFYDDKPVRPAFQIFATDLSDQTALDKARAGVYPESIEAEVSPERLRRFFKREDHIYRIDKSIRDMCVFARQNVTADPPFSHLDLISCRNLLIYLSTPLQKRIIPTFHYALNTPGFLVLGSAETIGDNAELFEVVDRSNKIYSKKPTLVRSPIHYSTEGLRGLESLSARRFSQPGPAPAEAQREADRVLLGRYSPPGVLVNDNFDVIQYRGVTSAYLESPPGEPTTNVLKLAREGLFLDLRAALADARTRNETVRREGVRLRTDGRFSDVTLEVVPIKSVGMSEQSFLVLFHENGKPKSEETGNASVDPAPALAEKDRDRHLVQLQQELAATREYLQSLVEQQDAANEELRSANEEILSSNEELQSTNEELETAKEELQSTNEELNTVNEQLNHRNVELTELNNDMTNLMTSTTIPVVMVGGDLRIRRFTAPAKKVMNLLQSDIGRPIGDIKPAIVVPDLDAIIETVMETGQPQERVAQDRSGRWLSLRITPYRKFDNRIDGAVLLLVDVDAQKHAEELLRNADRRKDEFLATLAHELRNPVSPIVNAVDIMRLAGDDAPKVQEAREVLYRQVRQLSRIVEDLIDVSRIIEHKVELRREVVTLSAVMDTALESCLSQIEGREHHLNVSLPAEPVKIFADPVRLSQIVINLVNNAAKFTNRGGQISISATVQHNHLTGTEDGAALPPPPPYLVLKVRDTGIGIPLDLQPHVFDMFTQGDRQAETQAGLGIGLSLVRALSEMHGGDVQVSSEGIGEGSEFVVRLPLNLEFHRRRREDRERPRHNGDASPRKVLIVDDNEDQAQTLGMLMTVLGHETHLAFDGLSAVSAAKAFMPDVALVDIGIPGINGYEVARQIRQIRELDHVVLVAQTGWGNEDDRSRSRLAGFDDHMVKPLDIEALQRILAAGPKARV